METFMNILKYLLIVYNIMIVLSVISNTIKEEESNSINWIIVFMSTLTITYICIK